MRRSRRLYRADRITTDLHRPCERSIVDIGRSIGMFDGFESADIPTGDTHIFVRHGGSGPPVLVMV
jgi:hypothetical protein